MLRLFATFWIMPTIGPSRLGRKLSMLEICTNSPPDCQRFTCGLTQCPFWFAKFTLQDLFEAFPFNTTKHFKESSLPYRWPHCHHNNDCQADPRSTSKTSRKAFSRFPFNGVSRVPNSRRSKTQCEGLVGQCRAQAFLDVKQNLSNSQILKTHGVLCLFVSLRYDKGPWLHGWWSSLMQWARCNASGDSSPVARGLVDKCSFVAWGCFKYFGKNLLSRE